MRQIRLVTVLSAIVLMAFTGSALADSTTVAMNFASVGGANGGGVYTYPYNFTVNGTSTSLICDAFDNEVQVGESWTATVTSLLSDQGMFSGNANSLLDYKAAGLIFNGIVNGTINQVAGNWAIWALFSPNAYNNSYFTSSGAIAIYNQALAGAANAPDSLFANLVVYTPIPGTQKPSALGLPQEYIGISVPEPGEYALLLTALLFGVLAFMKKRQGLKATLTA